MITAAKLTRTALELDIPADVFQEVATNLRDIEANIAVAFHTEFNFDDFNNREQQAEVYRGYRRGQIQNLLEKES